MRLRTTQFLGFLVLGASSMIGEGCADTAMGQTGAVPQEVTNLVGFHMIDFIAWNNRDFAAFRHYHASDVQVIGEGFETTGIESHVSWAQDFLQNSPDSIIPQHAPSIAQGEWTCVVGRAPDRGPFMATVGRWVNGAVATEYLLTTPVDAAMAPAIQGNPIATLMNVPSLAAETGAEPGWSCSFGQTAEGGYVATLVNANDSSATLAFMN